MSIRLCFAVIFSFALAAGTAFAQNAAGDTGVGASGVFGNGGQFAISSDATLSIQHTTGDVTTVSLAPGADYFVAKNLSIGGMVLLQYQHSDSASVTRFGIGPRVGYNFAFTDMFGIWPKLGFSFTHASYSLSVASLAPLPLNSLGGSAFTLNLFAPLMFHPVPHFFVGFGPFLDADLSGNNKITTYGAQLTIGGWFDT